MERQSFIDCIKNLSELVTSLKEIIDSLKEQLEASNRQYEESLAIIRKLQETQDENKATVKVLQKELSKY